MRAARHFLRRFLRCCRSRRGRSPIPDPLFSFRAKIARAKEHLRVLQSAIDAYADDPEAYALIKDSHPESGLYQFKLKIGRPVPMTEWALLIGDCIHNARSALDHFYWQLVLLKWPKGNPPADWKAGFPICDKPERFKEKEVENFVGPTATAIIKALQPYNTGRPEDMVLRFLHKSDITDKHRLLVPNVGLIQSGQAKAKLREVGKPPSGIKNIVHFQPSLHDGAVMAAVVVTPPDSVVDVDLIAPRIGISFERRPGKVLSVPKALATLILEAEEMPDNFPGFF